MDGQVQKPDGDPAGTPTLICPPANRALAAPSSTSCNEHEVDMMNSKNLLSSFDSVSIADELKSYGFDVIESDTAFGYEGGKRATQTFIDRYEIMEGTHILRTEPGLLVGRLHDPGCLAEIDQYLKTGWAFEPGEAVTADTAVARLSDRLRASEVVTVTPGTVPLLERALAEHGQDELSGIQRWTLGAIRRFVSSTGWPVLVVIWPSSGLRLTIGLRSARRFFARFPRKRVRWWPRG